MKKYKLVSKKGEGTFSEVVKVQNIKDGTYHAIKCMKSHFSSLKQVRYCYCVMFIYLTDCNPDKLHLFQVGK